jgi:hypothetical protein
MSYTIDVVRLATSALLAIREDQLSCQPTRACDTILEGYTEGIKKGGAPFILEEHNRWLGKLARNDLREPVVYWKKFERLDPLDKPPPNKVKTALLKQLPKGSTDSTMRHRQAGLGSLGRERVTLLANYQGARVCREAKPLVPSSWFWARNETPRSKLWYEEALTKAVRAPDPYVVVHAHWVIRRLAPDCSRIELGFLPRERDELRLMWAMGKEVANVHLGSESAVKSVAKDLTKRAQRWLREAAATAAKVILKDWQEFKNYHKSQRHT